MTLKKAGASEMLQYIEKKTFKFRNKVQIVENFVFRNNWFSLSVIFKLRDAERGISHFFTAILTKKFLKIGIIHAKSSDKEEYRKLRYDLTISVTLKLI